MQDIWHKIIFSMVFILAGINHFINPKVYLKIIPDYFKNKVLINQISGLAEIVLGIGLMVPKLQNLSAYGLILLLICVFPANINMLINKKASFNLPKWLLIIRLPIQLILIIWALIYTNEWNIIF